MMNANKDVPSKFFYEVVPSPFGNIAVIWKEKGARPSVVRILLPREGLTVKEAARREGFELQRRSVPAVEKICARIKAYLEGKSVVLHLTPLDIESCYPFQRRVILADREIPRGKVSTYGALALRLGVPRAARAVGTALARNPFPLIIPCHRVVRSDGSIGGYGGGLKMKRALLEMEGVRFDAKGRVEKDHIQ